MPEPCAKAKFHVDIAGHKKFTAHHFHRIGSRSRELPGGDLCVAQKSNHKQHFFEGYNLSAGLAADKAIGLFFFPSSSPLATENLIDFRLMLVCYFFLQRLSSD
jgi:hypothetical protein